MSAFIQQLPALIGVVIGALGSYVAIVRGDRARFRRERAARWEERRLSVYADYARALRRRHADVPGRRPPRQRPPSASAVAAGGRALLAEAADAGDPAGEALLLLGSPEVVEKARAWVVVVMEMERFLRGHARPRGLAGAAGAAARGARQGYYAAVREDLSLMTERPARWQVPPLHARPDPGPVAGPGSPEGPPSVSGSR